ncbi:24651_t:CDS:1, partial [Racocetra persica]
MLDRSVDNTIKTVELQTIIKRIIITILYDNGVDKVSSITIREILYKYNNKWKIRNVIYSYKHPSEFAILKEPTSSLPVYKLYIDIYYDDF